MRGLDTLKKLQRELVLAGAALLALGGGLVAYREFVAGHGGAPMLPAALEAPLSGLDGLDRRWILGGIGGALAISLVLLFGLLRAAVAPRRSWKTWLLAFLVLAACGGAIAGLYYAPGDIRISESLRIHRVPQAEFLNLLGWIAVPILGAHFILFVIFAAASRRSAGARERRAAERRPKMG